MVLERAQLQHLIEETNNGLLEKLCDPYELTVRLIVILIQCNHYNML